MSIIKTQGTKESVGAFMVYDENDECLFDEDGNNAWDTLEEANEVEKNIKLNRELYLQNQKANPDDTI
jgi:hypothetical protein